jgi:hypothetical protein
MLSKGDGAGVGVCGLVGPLVNVAVTIGPVVAVEV